MQDQRGHFHDRPVWNEPEQDRRFKEPQQYERWEQRDPTGPRRHDERNPDFNQARDNAPRKDHPQWTDDSFRPDDWRQPQRPPLDEMAMPPREQSFGAPPDFDRRQARPPFDSRQENQAPRSLADQGQPGHFQGGNPNDRQQFAASSQV